MNFTIYAAISAAITLFFVVSFIKQRKPFQLAFAIWVPTTLLQYVSTNRVFFNILSGVELVLFAVTLSLLWIEQIKRKKEAEKEDLK